MTLNDRRDTGRDPLVGHSSEDADQGAAPRVLAHPGAQQCAMELACAYGMTLAEAQARISRALGIPHDSAVWEPQAASLETGRVASHPGPVTEDASRIAEDNS